MSFTIIIPSRNINNLVACAYAIRAAGETAKILVIDDGLDMSAIYAGEKSPNGLCVNDPGWRIPGEKPFIYARNCNIGIRSVTDDVILLNDDALLVTQRGFSKMQESAEAFPQYGVIAACTDMTGNPRQQPHAAGVLCEEPRMACFVAAYIPRRTFEAVGLLDERFIGYGYEDDDFCARVRREGLKVGIDHACFVNHSSLKSTFRGYPAGQVSLDQNRDVFIAKWGRLDV